MQNKGLIKVFAILFGLVCIYQLSFTFIASSIEKDAEAYANQQVSADEEDYSVKRDLAEQRYLDSIANEEIIAGITYESAKEKELNQGLDLKGGINVILQISVKDILRGLANNSDDPAFNQALAEADAAMKESQDDYIDLFFRAFNNIPGARLASPDIFANKDLSDDINFEMSNSEVEPIIRQRVSESITAAFEVLRKRIDKFGVTQPNIQRLGQSGRILVELPGAKDISRVKTLLQSTAQLGFWFVHKNNEFGDFLFTANNVIADLVEDERETTTPETDTLETQADTLDTDDEIEALLASAEDTAEVPAGDNPLLDRMVSPGFQGGPVLATFRAQDTAQVRGYLNLPQVRSLLPSELRYAKFVWGVPKNDVVELYALESNREGTPPLTGDVITDAQQTFDQLGRIAVSMQMNGKGAKIWEEMTTRASAEQGNIAIVLDNTVYSAPTASNPISGGRSEITGDFDITEGQDLANVLRAGRLPASAEIIQSEIVGPSLGQEAIDSGMKSFLIALAFVLVWMVFYYGKAGLFADVALVVNILFIFGILAGLGAVLTLPGIAGIVLTIGISVDANVLIFERIKEELAKGKSQKDSIKDGFNNALSSILDANITTGLTALILLTLGTGPVKGFATTLLIGIATSLFTAIFITRMFIDGYGKNGKDLAFATSTTKGLFQNMKIKFLAKRKVAYIISGVLILISVVSLFVNGLNQGVDFVGGRSYTVRFDQNVNATDVQNDLVAVFGSAEAKTFGANNQLKITTNYRVDDEGEEVDTEIQEMMYEALQPYFPDDVTYDDFTIGASERSIGIMQSMKVGPTIADDIKNDSFWAIIGSLIVVFLYILLRFRKWQFSLGAVAAVAHDVTIVLGIFSLFYAIMPFSMEINQAFIAAILTVVGYSINDTVVIFDRIREYVNEHPGRPLGRTIDNALNSTISRTLNTSLTTLIVLLAIFIFGGESLRGFMFAMIIGIIVGTYSSLFVATPIMFDSVKKKDKIESRKKEAA